MPPVPPDIVRVQVRWVWHEEIAVNNINIHVSGPTNNWPDTTQRVADAVADAYQKNWAALAAPHHSAAQIVRFDAYHLDAATGKTIEKRTHVVPSGTMKGVATDPLPPEVASVVSLYAYNPAEYDPQGARKRGRIYLPFLAASIVDANGRNRWWSQTSAAYTSLMNELKHKSIDQFGETPLGNVELLPVVMSRRWNEQHQVQAVIVDDLFDVQKRRQNNLTSGRPATLLEA